MSSRDDDFQARIKRVRARAGRGAPTPNAPTPNAPMRNAPMPAARRRVVADDADEHAAILGILRPQLAFVLGVAAMIGGRAFAMNSLMLEPSTEVLGAGEGIVVLAILAGLGLLLFRRDAIALGALVVGAALGFLLEGYFIPVMPELMSTLYTPDYVGLVILNAS